MRSRRRRRSEGNDEALSRTGFYPACGECCTCQGTVGAPGTCEPETGAPCGAAATCTDGELQPRGTCDGNGACQPAAPVSCEPYTKCAENACASRCDGNDDCVADSFCLVPPIGGLPPEKIMYYIGGIAETFYA